MSIKKSGDINTVSIDWGAMLKGVSKGKTVVTLRKNGSAFRQGDSADSVYFIQKGTVRISLTSEHDKEAAIATLKPNEFFGEGCLAQQTRRMASATATEPTTLLRIEKGLMQRLLHERPKVAEVFLARLLAYNVRCEEDLCDQMFNNTERRLARVLLLLAHFGKDGTLTPLLPAAGTDRLAQMVGVSRFEISHVMNKFEKLGFVELGDKGSLSIHSSLLTSILNE